MMKRTKKKGVVETPLFKRTKLRPKPGWYTVLEYMHARWAFVNGPCLSKRQARRNPQYRGEYLGQLNKKGYIRLRQKWNGKEWQPCDSRIFKMKW